MRTVESRSGAFRWSRWLAAACLVLLAASPALAQSIAGYSEYFIPADETNMWYVFDNLDNATTTPMHSVIAVTAWSANTTVYYDHWENGYNFDPNNPATADETVILATAGAQRVFESANIPTAPRGTATFYDGGDRIYVAGGTVTVTRASWIESVGAGNQSAAWEIYPVKPQLTTYVLPFGENLGFAPFTRVYVLIQATTNNTTFTVDLNGDGTPDLINANRNISKSAADGDATTVTLNAGQTFLLDRISACSTNVAACTTNPGTLNAGTVVQGSATLQVKFVAGNPGQNYCARGLSAFPRGFWTTDYYAPLDHTTTAGRGETDYYLHNPHATAITVNWASRTASGSFSIPANSTVSYRAAVGNVPIDSGLFFRGSDVFWGVGIADSLGQTYEWGYSLLPSTFLFKEHFLGWAPGYASWFGGGAANYNDVGAFLTVAQDNTRVFVDLNNDGTVDQTYTLDRLQTQYISDPTDGSLSQAHIWATGDFTMAYGENGDTADTSNPSLDLGYVAIPGTDFMSLVLGVTKSVSPQIVPTAVGSQSTFTLKVNSEKYEVNGITVIDTLPASWGYVNNSTTITLADQTSLSGASANPTVVGQVLTWPSTLLGNMAENQEVTIVFTAQTTGVLTAGTLSQNRVQAVGTRTLGKPSVTQTFTTTDFAYVTTGNAYGAVAIDKTSDAATPLYPGDTFTYTTAVTNPGLSGTTLTAVSILDPIPSGATYVAGSGLVSCELAAPSNLRDTFSAVAYTNTNGSVDWSGSPWTETDPQGGGAASGAVLVTGGSLRLSTVADNVRDEFANAAYTNNGPGNSAGWAGDWTETDSYGSGPAGAGAGAAGGFVWVTGGQLEFRYLLSTVGDQFASTAYNLNTGSDNWTGPWTESVGLDGLPATAANRQIYITGQRLRFDRATGNTFGISRTASVATGSTVTITFTPYDAGFSSGEAFVAEYRVNTGTFNLLGTYDGNGAPASWNGVQQTFTINNFPGTSITLQFRATGAWDNNADHADIDDVRIAYTTPANATGAQIQRTADLVGALGATLTFAYTAVNLVAGDTVEVQASADGANFTTLETFDGATGTGVARSYDLISPTNFTSANTTVRFRVTSGFGLATKTFSIDNVDITYRIGTAVQRAANLTGSSYPVLSFTYTSANLVAGDTLVVEASAGAAGPFTTLATFAGGTPSVAPPYTLAPSLISANTTIRFRPSAGFAATTKTLSIDNVDISWGVVSSFASGNPPEFLSGSTGCRVRPGGTPVTLTFNATVVDPLPTGLTEITNTASTTSTQFPIAISDSVTNIVANPSVLSATVGDRVWLDADGDGSQDIGEPGIANVEVTLKDQWGTPVGTTVTDVNGRYLFTGVKAGSGYYVEVTANTLPTGLTQSFPGTNNRSTTFPLSDGQSYTGADLGYKPTEDTATFGDLVWVDANNNRVRDPGEIGRGGVTVRLHMDTNNNGVVDGTEVVVDTITAPDGSYLFTGAAASGTETYIVSVDPTQGALTGYTSTNPPPSRSYPNASSGGSYLDADFGFQATGVTTWSITDRVWLDDNGDKAFAGESGIAGVTMELLNASLQVIGTTTTATDGTFTFSGLTGGGADYTTRISDTAGVLVNYFGTTTYAQARQRAESNLAANVDHTSSPDSSGYGFRGSRSIGDTIFFDLDGDGVQDTGDAPPEKGIAGVEVTLYLDTNGDGLIAGEPQVGKVTTDANGKYLFTGLLAPPAYYIVSVPVPTGYGYTGPGADTDNNPANGIQKRRQLPSGGGNDLDADFGFRATTPRTVSGTIWNDANTNGVKDTGESGIAGVTLDVLSASGVVVATLTTAVDGTYSVAGLAAGTYTVRVTDTSNALTGYAPTYEKTEGTNPQTTPPFDYQESVNLTSADVTDVNFGYAKPLPTYAAVGQLRAYRDDGSVTVEWRTSLEVGTVGFHVLRLDPATGQYVQLTERLVPGLIVSPQGGVYRFRDAAAPTEGRLTYALLEEDVHGRSHHYGPYTVSVADRAASRALDGGASEELRRRGFSRQALAPSRMRQALRATVEAEHRLASAQRVRRGGRVFKVTTRESGIHYLPAAGILPSFGPAGQAASLMRAGQLRLTHRGSVVPYLPDGSLRGVYFYAEPVESPYTDENAYWATVAQGPTMSVRPAVPTGLLATSFGETLHAEQEQYPLLNSSTDPGGDFWVWDYLFAGYDGFDTRSFTIRASGVTGAGDASLTVHLLGGTDSAPGDDHHVQVLFNGLPVGEARWDGLAPFDLGVPIAPASVLEGDNVVEVKAVLDSGVSESLFFVDSFDLAYERRYEAVDDALSFTAANGTDVAVGGFSGPGVLLFDVTIPSRPVLLTDTVVSMSGDGRYEVRFGAAGARDILRYEALLPGRAKRPNGVAPWQDTGLRGDGNAADYVLVAPESLKPAAATLAAYRNGRGIATVVVGLEDVYDEFNAGIAEPIAIRAFLRYAASHWSTPPRYVTLVGRGTWDYKDRRGFGDNLVPTLLTSSPDGLVASDVAYADLTGDDGIPEVAIGRLPVLTAQELLDYVAKIQAHESAASGEWQKRVLLTADNADAAGNFPADSESVAALLPSGYTAGRVHLDTTTAAAGRQAILEAVNDGVVAFNYIGHGSLDKLADENLFTRDDDVPSLHNADRLPVFLAMTCSAGDFAQPGYPSLGEAMLLRKDGGAFAVWAPSGLSQNALAVRLDQSFFRGAFVDDEKVVGDLVVRGIRELDAPGSQYMRYMYNLLGEPVSRIPD
jgi:uncharacterized repeat protein (TIGR01451 family)